MMHTRQPIFKLLIFSLIFSWGIFNVQAQEPVPSAQQILDEAYAVAKKENKKVFIIFHASWCGWCHRMDTSMNDPSCKKFFDDNFVVRHLTVDEAKDKMYLENPGANAFRTKYHGDNQGIPFWLIFDQDGKLLADSKIRKPGEGPAEGSNAGCPASEEEVNFFVNILSRTTPLQKSELAIIAKRFRKNEH
ncbi:MAG: thioredoxin family protein [Chitinophagaceae bacterium]|nr:thioredoxin family protein [Chitinophagaceae bacterium]